MPDLGDLRLTRRGGLTFAFNYGQTTVEAPAPQGARFHLGARQIDPAGVAAWAG